MLFPEQMNIHFHDDKLFKIKNRQVQGQFYKVSRKTASFTKSSFLLTSIAFSSKNPSIFLRYFGNALSKTFLSAGKNSLNFVPIKYCFALTKTISWSVPTSNFLPCTNILLILFEA